MIELKSRCDQYQGKGNYVARIEGRDSKYTFRREFIGRAGRCDVDEPGLYEVRDIDKKGRVEDSYPLILADGPDLVEVMASKEDAMTIAKAMDAGRPFGEIVEFRAGNDASPLFAAKAVRAEHAARLAAGEGKDAAERIPCPRECPSYQHDGYAPRGDVRAWREAEIVRLDAEISSLAGSPEIAPTADGHTILSAKAAQTKKAVEGIDAAVEECYAVLVALDPKDAAKALAALKARLAAAKV